MLSSTQEGDAHVARAQVQPAQALPTQALGISAAAVASGPAAAPAPALQGLPAAGGSMPVVGADASSSGGGSGGAGVMHEASAHAGSKRGESCVKDSTSECELARRSLGCLA